MLHVNPIGDGGAVAIIEGVPPALETLGVGGTGIGMAAVEAVVAAVPRLRKLRRLNLGHNELGRAGAAALRDALPGTRLEELVLTGTGLEEADKALFRAAWSAAGKPEGGLKISSGRRVSMR